MCAAGGDVVDAQADEPVVDQHLVAGLQHLPTTLRGNRQVVAGRLLAADDDELLARDEQDALRQVADVICPRSAKTASGLADLPPETARATRTRSA